MARRPPLSIHSDGVIGRHNQAEAQLLLGTLFFFGRGVPQSYVSAFAWCDIAATNGQSDASECRDVALEHMTHDETAQSFKIVTDWLASIHARRDEVGSQ